MFRKNIMLHHNPHLSGCCGNGGENCCGSHEHEDHVHAHSHMHEHGHVHTEGHV